jgi:hypothetical protein
MRTSPLTVVPRQEMTPNIGIILPALPRRCQLEFTSLEFTSLARFADLMQAFSLYPSVEDLSFEVEPNRLPEVCFRANELQTHHKHTPDGF